MPRGSADFEEQIKSRDRDCPDAIYRYFDMKGVKATLTNRSLRFCSPVAYNDPFDCGWDPTWVLRTPEAKARHFELLREAIENPSSWPPGMPRSWRLALEEERKSIAHLQDTERESRIREFIGDASAYAAGASEFSGRLDKLRERMRVCSFTNLNDSILMWSHYADKHRGVVLGFDRHLLECSLRVPIMRVEYRESLPATVDVDSFLSNIIYGLNLDPSDERITECLTLAKYAQWAYEKEWRFVCVEPRYTPGIYSHFSFSPHCLVEVCFGAATDPSDRRTIMRLVREFGAKPDIVNMRSSPSQFALIREPIT